MLLTIGKKIQIGALSDFLRKPKKCYQAMSTKWKTPGSEKKYFAIPADELAEFSVDSPEELNAILQNLYTNQPEAQMAWADLRDCLAELHRLSRVAASSSFREMNEHSDELLMLAGLVATPLAKLSHGAFNLGFDASNQDPPDDRIKNYLPPPTPEGKRYVALFQRQGSTTNGTSGFWV